MNSKYATLGDVAMPSLVLFVVLLVARFFRGFIANIAVLIGVVVGALIATMLGTMRFNNVGNASFFGLVLPFWVGSPVFETSSILLMCIVMVIIMVESTGMFLALGGLVGRPVEQKDLSRGLRTDGIGTVIGGIFNTFPYTSFSHNVGLVGVTGVCTRYVCVAGGIILMVLGLIPKLGTLVEAIPTFVLGGAGLVMFGMVSATGIRVLAKVDYEHNRNDLFIVAISIGLGMVPLVAPDFKQWMPHGIHPIIESSIVLVMVTVVLLNLFFNGTRSNEEALKQAAENRTDLSNLNR